MTEVVQQSREAIRVGQEGGVPGAVENVQLRVRQLSLPGSCRGGRVQRVLATVDQQAARGNGRQQWP
jgi:hypothetical protein